MLVLWPIRSMLNFVSSDLECTCSLETGIGRSSLSNATDQWVGLFLSLRRQILSHAHNAFPQDVTILQDFTGTRDSHFLQQVLPPAWHKVTVSSRLGQELPLATATLETNVLGDGCRNVFLFSYRMIPPLLCGWKKIRYYYSGQA